MLCFGITQCGQARAKSVMQKHNPLRRVRLRHTECAEYVESSPHAVGGLVTLKRDDYVTALRRPRFFIRAGMSRPAEVSNLVLALVAENERLTAMLAKNLSLLCVVAVTIMALPAMADVKVVGTQSDGAPLTIKTDFGKVADAVNLGGESLTCDGVKFTGQTVPENTVASQTIETTPFTVTLSTKSGNLASVALAGGDALFHSEIYSLGFQDIALKISGLDLKKTYQIQYLHGDFRTDTWGKYTETKQTFTDSKGNQATSNLAFNTAANKDQYVIVTVEVTGSESLLYDMPRSANRGPSFSGFVVLEKP